MKIERIRGLQIALADLQDAETSIDRARKGLEKLRSRRAKPVSRLLDSLRDAAHDVAMDLPIEHRP